MPNFPFNGFTFRIVALAHAYNSNIVKERLNFNNIPIKTGTSMYFMMQNISISY